MKKCPVCGKTYLDSDVSFCELDGAPLVDDTQEAAPVVEPEPKPKSVRTQRPAAQPTTQPAVQLQNSKKGGFRGLFLVIGLVILGVVIISGITIVSLFGFSFDKPKKSAAVATTAAAETMTDAATIGAASVETTAFSETAAPGETAIPSTAASTESGAGQVKGAKMYVNYFNRAAASTMAAGDSTGNRYDADLVLDGDLSTAWIEGAGGDGVGEMLTLSTANGEKRDVCGVRIYGGYQKSDDLRRKNGEPSKITLGFDDGTTFDVTMDTNADYTEAQFDDIATSWITFTISGIKAGAQYSDTAISEILILGYDDGSGTAQAKKPVKVVSGTQEYFAPETAPTIAAAAETFAAVEGDYIFPESSNRYLTDAEVAAVGAQSKELLRYARNEIYARHGRKFKDAALQAYFNSKSWYQGTVDGDRFNDTVLNEYEKKNCDMIKKYE